MRSGVDSSSNNETADNATHDNVLDYSEIDIMIDQAQEAQQEEEYYLSYGQQVTISILPMISGILSMIGSLLIVYMILSDRKEKKLSKVKHRLLLCMSIIDMIPHSIWFVLWSIPIPTSENEIGVVFNYGNRASCTAQGFFIQLGIAVPCYNASLCIYYYLVVCCKKSNADIATTWYYEPLMHIISIGYPLLTAIVSLFIQGGLYNYDGLGCWIAPYPRECKHNEDIECIRGQNAYAFQWLFAGIEEGSAAFIIIITMYLVYRHVKSVESTMIGRYGVVKRTPSSSKSVVSSSLSLSKLKRSRSSSSSLVEHHPEHSERSIDGAAAGGFDASSSNLSLGSNSCRTIDNNDTTSSPMRTRSPRRVVRKRTSSSNNNQANNNNKKQTHSQKALHQALQYVAAVVGTRLWSFVVVIIDEIGGQNPFWVLVLQQFFFPFQGFWNAIIYITPYYEMVRDVYPSKDKSFWFCLRMSILNPPTEQKHKKVIMMRRRHSSKRSRMDLLQAAAAASASPPTSTIPSTVGTNNQNNGDLRSSLSFGQSSEVSGVSQEFHQSTTTSSTTGMIVWPGGERSTLQETSSNVLTDSSCNDIVEDKNDDHHPSASSPNHVDHDDQTEEKQEVDYETQIACDDNPGVCSTIRTAENGTISTTISTTTSMVVVDDDMDDGYSIPGYEDGIKWLPQDDFSLSDSSGGGSNNYNKDQNVMMNNTTANTIGTVDEANQL